MCIRDRWKCCKFFLGLGENLTRMSEDDQVLARWGKHREPSATAKHLGTAEQITDVPGILHNIEESPELRAMWDKYRKQFAYAQDITYEQIIDVVRTLVE